jgi:hypothetical protein
MKEAERYTQAAERKRLAAAAMKLLVRPKGEQKFPTFSAQDGAVGKIEGKD